MQNKQAMYALAFAFLGVASATGVGMGVAVPQAAHAAAPVSTANVITSVSVTTMGEATKITVVGTQPFTPDVRSLGRPSATVITVEGKWDAGRTGYTNVRRNNVFNVRAGRFADRPTPSVRIVANTRGILTHAARPLTADQTKWEILVGDAQSVRTATAASTAATKVVLASSEPAVPVLMPPSTVAVPMQTATEANSGALRLAADLARPTVSVTPAAAAGKSGPYPVLLKTPGVKKPGAPPALLPAAVIAAPVAAADRRVSLDFVAADIVDILKALSLQSGLNVVAGSDVKGTVTVALKNVPMIEALDMVTRLSGFRYAKVGSTYVVGTGASVAALSRSSSVGQAVSSTIPFYYSDGTTLEKSIIQAFPNVNISRVDVGVDAKKSSDSSSGNAAASSGSGAPFPSDAAAGATAPIPGSTASINQNTGRFGPRGGVMNVVGSQDEVEAVRTFVQNTEQGLVASARQQQDAENLVLAQLKTETYRLKYASPSDLVGIVNRLVPSVQVQAGPTQAFQPRTLNGSASFSGSSSPAGATAGGGAGSNTGAATTGAAASSGPIAPSMLPPTLILTGTPADLARARQILEEADVRAPQMQFEAKVIDINSSDIKQLGLRYDLSRTVNLGEVNSKAQGQAPTVGAAYSEDLRKPNFGAIFRSPYSITAALDALENDNKAHVLARPNLSALDGQSATVFIGDQIKYVINIQTTTTGQNIQTETATVGITLKVTGKASPDGTITLYVHPEVSSISSYLTLTNGIALPQIATRFVDTTIRVKDGETIGIGGLIQENDIRNIQKIPILGDLPFFGQLFRSTDSRKIRSEVVIFITSKVLKD